MTALATSPAHHISSAPPSGADPVLALVQRNDGLLAALDHAEDLDDVLQIHEQATGLSALARAARLGLVEQNQLAATRVRIQHRAGTMLRELASEPRATRAKRPRGKGPLRPQLPRGVLGRYGISGQESWLWQAMASVPIADVEHRLDELLAAGDVEVTCSEFVRLGRASLRKRRSSREGASPAALRLQAALSNLTRIPRLTTRPEFELATKIARKLCDWGVLEWRHVDSPRADVNARQDLNVVAAVCLLCGRERESASARRCSCGGSWAPAWR
jgi:hypothetical protein